MAVAVLPALIPDIRRVYECYFAAFKGERMGEIMLKILFPGVDTDAAEFREAHAKGTLEYWHTSDSQYTFKAVDMANGEILGMGLVDIFVRERSEEERKNHGVPWLEGGARERAEKVLNPLHDMREHLFGGKPYIYAHVIGVDPRCQGRKGGIALAKFGLDLSERCQLPIYFESSPSSIGLYKKAGYEILKETIVHKAETLGVEEDIVVPLVVRMPSSANGMSFYEWKEKGYPNFNAPSNKLKL
ncbi:hypothetical protein QBC32DRAFT_129944 [Pseudoneurospora amorphoporcata]|uniref:N-acetyltransferase domain-containing protein n=1 Tax=Pseudoneurospora amorphoporcata TaxID=241081 RepID=A0AAN6NZI4_9PEZI|nr:hypothetical protein QBC32DRAFT_129944 [Pseudoneurospora amorphoporcata]